MNRIPRQQISALLRLCVPQWVQWARYKLLCDLCVISDHNQSNNLAHKC